MKEVVKKSICIVFVIVFVYAAIDKIWDHSKFVTQLGLSPFMFPGMDIAISKSVVVLLILSIMLLLINPSDMVFPTLVIAAFTIYIIAVLTIAPFVPCSCIGLSDRFTWHQQLYINIFLLVLSAIYFYLNRTVRKPQKAGTQARGKRNRIRRKIFVATTRDKP
ncbi:MULTISPECIES: MauE/DoxX family redox-associated membrane protein [Olivibacter]|uniref:MauE/DoxX family redox-associated membrane protein n=1 Tax=Olivibacter jilunii TaxID=985016 RepID=A0ABW6B4Z1_9SPHI